jgi:pimeloyl-ACP methyl ester carboxylesterase
MAAQQCQVSGSSSLLLFVMQVMYDANMQQLLPKIACPALLVVGEKDFR